DERGLAEGGRPRIEQHRHGLLGKAQLASRLIRRKFFVSQRSADHVADRQYLLDVAQGLGPSQHVLRSLVSGLQQRTDRDFGNVALVDRRRRGRSIWPAYDITRADPRR